MRCFVGFALPDAWREGLDSLAREWVPRFSSQLAWVRSEQRHITVQFIGETPEEDADALAKALPRLFPASFEARLADGGFFPHLRDPRVGWVGVGQGAPEMQACARNLGTLLESMHVAIETRPYRPHVTLFRVKGHAPRQQDPWGELLAHLGGLSWPVARLERLVLWKSELCRDGVHHVALAQAERAGRDDAAAGGVGP